MAEILKRTSFGLIRTNPKLTTNIKIVADTKNKVYLESIDADPLLSKSIYKGFEVTGGSYSRDLNRFYSQGAALLPKSIAYTVKERDESVQVKGRYKDQYDFEYCLGMVPKNSRLYTEEFSMFAPLWIEKDNVPDYFVIFKMDGPSTINYNDYNYTHGNKVNLDNDSILNKVITDPANFFENYIKKARVVKTFDLSNTTFIGQYIRNHVNDPLFPESSIYASLGKGEHTYWQGMSYTEGGFAKNAQDIYTDFVLVDKSVTENDDFLTMGFYNNDIVHPNILNLEFLFDDQEQTKYEFSRYFGMYVSAVDLGRFELDGNRLYIDSQYEFSQFPRPEKNVIGYSDNIESQVQKNLKGIKIYPKLGGTGGTSIYEGRLITWAETQNPRMPYVKDVNGNLYSIDASIGWTSVYTNGPTSTYTDDNFLRIKNVQVDWKNFTGFKEPFAYIPALETDKRGRPNFSFKVLDNPSTGDQIRIGVTDWTLGSTASQIDSHTIIGDYSLPAGTNNGLLFSTKGTNPQIAKAIVASINYIQTAVNDHQIFSAISKGDMVIVFSRLDSQNWNKIKYSMFSTSLVFPFSKPDEFQPIVTQPYMPSPVSVSSLIIGQYYEYHFTGGCDNPSARFTINYEDFQEFKDFDDPVYMHTSEGFDQVGEYSLYLDEPILNSLGQIIDFVNVNKYVSYHIKNTRETISWNSSKKISLYKTAKNTNGYLSMYPIRDFDFDFFDTTYMKSADSNYLEFYSWYQGDIQGDIRDGFLDRAGMTYSGGTIPNPNGELTSINFPVGSTPGFWPGLAYSTIGATDGIYLSAKPNDLNVMVGFGLTTNPSIVQGWSKFDYMWYLYSPGGTAPNRIVLQEYDFSTNTENDILTLPAWNLTQNFSMTYDGLSIRYYIDNNLIHTTIVPTPNIVLKPTFTFLNADGKGLSDIRFGNLFQPTFVYADLGATASNLLQSLVGDGSAFAVGGEFQSISGMADDILDTNSKVTNEYDRLKEHYLPELALSSKVVPFINKWVYDNESTDVRENPYRLNTDQAFGYSNFSPSFDEIGLNPKFFTHEWFYLQKYPPYMSFEEKLNSYSYFDEDLYFPHIPSLGVTGSTAAYAGLTGGTGASANLLSIEEDYFLSYFTRETVDHVEIPRDFKYTLFEYGSDSYFSETLFRGAKVIIKDRSEYSPINFNVESLNFLANPKYNGYKFSAVLTYGDSGTQYTVIKNDKWKAITLVITADLNDTYFLSYYEGVKNDLNKHKFIDRSSLYTLKHKLSIDTSLSAPVAPNLNFIYDNINISGAIYKWQFISPSRWLVYATTDNFGNIPNFAAELNINENGGFQPITVKHPSTLLNYSITFDGISEPTTNTFYCSSITGIGVPSPTNAADDLEIGNGYTIISSGPGSWFGDPSPDLYNWAITTQSQMVYINGGYNGYVHTLESLSFASIADSINSGEPEIRYINVSETGELTFNHFAIELVRPDYPTKSTYLKPSVIKIKPVDLQNSDSIIGYEMSASDRIDIHALARYRGAYNPKWHDLVKFVDTNEIKGYTGIDGKSLTYNNIQILTKTDDLNDTNLFVSKNLHFNKVNVESPNVILRFNDGKKAESIFPLIGEVAIDKKDFFLFKSSWDTQYYDKYLKATRRVPQIGTREPKENKSFFGSKTISIPDIVRIETFPSGVISNESIGQLIKIKSVPQNIVKQEIVKNKNRYLDLRVFTTLALSDYLIADGITEAFNQYISPNYSFGNPNAEDDVKTYISENIYDRYIVKEIILWEKFWKKGNPLPAIQTQMTDTEKIKAGYTRTKHFQTTFATPNDLDFQLIYNIPQDRNYSIAFTVVLEKK